jgi:hypothetical protein
MTELSNETQKIHIQFNKIFMLSDIHMGVRSNSLEWLNNQEQYFYDFYIPFLKKHSSDGDIFFMLGDFFDNRQSLDIGVMNSAIKIIENISSIMPVHMLTGNHDIYKKQDTDINSLVVFRRMENVTIYEKPITLSNGTVDILVIPWIGDSKKEEEIIKDNPSDFVFIHTNLSGFRYDNGMTIKRGTNIETNTRLKRIYSGHIHKRQESKMAVYLGSPYHTKRSDVGNKKGVYVLNTGDKTADFYPNTFSPIFQKLRLENILDWSLERVKGVLENNYTDIIVPDEYIHLFNLTKFIDLLEGCKYKRVETIGEKEKVNDDIEEILHGTKIKDINTLIEMSIDEMKEEEETKNRLKDMNKKYYDMAFKTDQE